MQIYVWHSKRSNYGKAGARVINRVGWCLVGVEWGRGCEAQDGQCVQVAVRATGVKGGAREFPISNCAIH